jgi:hypothetical protein
MRATPTSVVITDSAAAGSGIVRIANNRDLFRCSKYSRVLTLGPRKPPPQREISKAVAPGNKRESYKTIGRVPRVGNIR